MADFGMRVRDASGAVMWTITDRLGRFLGTLNTGTTSGSLTNAAFAEAGAQPFCFCHSLSSDPYLVQPDVTFSGSTMAWSWPTDAAYNAPCVLIYGVR